MAGGTLTCGQFTDILIRRTERLDEEIVQAILPTDQWAGSVETGKFPAFKGTSHTFDRIERVVPDLTGAWNDVPSQSCVGRACDKDEKRIGFGSTRDSYSLKEKSYATDLYCFDLIMSADRAKEQFAGIISNLKEASIWIQSDWLRLEALRIAGKKWLAVAAQTDFTFTWNSDMTEITCSALPTSKLNATMLQRRVQTQISLGAMGQRPQGTPMLLELVTDMDTVYSLTQGNTAVNDKWRFEDFGSAGEKFYKLGWAGKVGNFALRVDLFPPRFMNRTGNILQRVFPFRTVSTTNGIRSIPNPDYENAAYQISYIHHRKAFKNLVRDTAQINPMMPYLSRDFAGKWMFVMDNLGTDANGCVIENKRRNKGQFIADFGQAVKAERPEWEEAILHLREPGCVATTAMCNASLTSLYNNQAGLMNSANGVCSRVFVLTPVLNASNIYAVPADSIRCNNQAIDHAAITTPTTLALLVTALNSVASSMGTWAVVAGSATQIQLTTTTCLSVEIPFTPP